MNITPYQYKGGAKNEVDVVTPIVVVAVTCVLILLAAFA